MRRVAILVVVLLAAVGSTGALAYDVDGDGVATTDELSGATDPIAADTDADGLADGREAALGSSPVETDTDGDGLTDRAEAIARGSNPTEADSDGDGLDDAAEVNDRGTDPTEADTDADDLDDAVELRDHGTDPTSGDTDGDSVADGTELRRGSSPTTVDTDADGLDDAAEHERGTDFATADTDADGFADGVEVHAESKLAGSDPLRKDVFLELDHMRGTGVPEAEIGRIEAAFANAPVSNPDGSNGITLHVRTSESPVDAESSTSLRRYRATHYDSEYDAKGYGYYHALVVENVRDDGDGGNRVGVTSSRIDGMIVEHRPNGAAVAGTLMHELGHNLGLHPRSYRGIDSYDVQYGRYPSVMNYHRPGRCDCKYDFSDGSRGTDDFDDWGRIESLLAEESPDSNRTAALLPSK